MKPYKDIIEEILLDTYVGKVRLTKTFRALLSMQHHTFGQTMQQILIGFSIEGNITEEQEIELVNFFVHGDKELPSIIIPETVGKWKVIKVTYY